VFSNMWLMCFKDFELGSRLIVILCGFITSSTHTRKNPALQAI